MVYVKPEVRKGLLGRMLTELLKTRVMVKQAMKGIKNDKVLVFLQVRCNLNGILGAAKDTRCQTAQSEIHRQRYIRLYRCYIFWPYARSRNRR